MSNLRTTQGRQMGFEGNAFEGSAIQVLAPPAHPVPFGGLGDKVSPTPTRCRPPADQLSFPLPDPPRYLSADPAEPWNTKLATVSPGHASCAKVGRVLLMRFRMAVRAVALLAVALGVAVTPTAGAPQRPAPVAETVLQPGETLEEALRRNRVNAAQAAGIIAALRDEVAFRRLQSGERVRVAWGHDGRIRQVTYQPAPTVRYELRPEGSRWHVRKVSLPVATRVVPVAGALEGSLFESLERLGETPALAARFVHLFEWDFDFAADALPGDRFRLLVEKRFVNGELVGYGSILIAQYRSAGRPTLTAVAFAMRNGKLHYFDAAGRAVRKMFLRAPLDFTRITSGYSQSRRHPILGGVRPHLAVDYAAPPGTPVRAVADGIVEAAGWNGGNGLSITLRHARSYKTMYNHLSKVAVRRGQHVRQRQVIGRVGSTGLSTGPHLDYRVIRQGRFVDPLAERFIPGAPVPGSHLAAFRQHRDGLLKRLEREAPF